MTSAKSFSDLGLSADILSAVSAAGFEQPTAIQAEGIPPFLSGGDIIIQAQTGTGKTAAFVLPIVEQLDTEPGKVGALVLTPTRELAQQVCVEFEKFGANRGLKATAIYGGTSFERQFEALETAQVVVATPGRLLDLLRRKRFDADHIRFFGLDEADELLSMGFEKDVLDVIAQIPKERRSFLCSATLNDAVHRVARNFISDPTEINVSSDEIGARSVRHEYFSVRASQKLEALRRLVQSEASTGAIVFANTRAATFRVTAALKADDVAVDVLNGDLSQAEREAALGRMKDDSVRFLVATDVAARGIDISGLPAVINYDMPESPDVYIHRTGRTGRAGQAGVAYSLVEPSDVAVFHALEKFYKLELHPRDLPTKTSIRTQMADRVIDEVLANLDADARLDYAAHIPLARRLSERGDGPRVIAKLIAHYAESPSVAVVAANDAPVSAPAKAAAPPVAAPVAAVESTADADHAGDTPAPERRRRRRRGQDERDDQPVVAQATEEPADTSDYDAPKTQRAANGVPSADDLAEALTRVSRRRGRWRKVAHLAEDFDVSEEDICAILGGDERFEQSRKYDNQWRLAEAPARSDDDKPTRRDDEKSARTDDETADAPKPRRERSERARKPKAEPKPSKRQEGFVTLSINVGARHGLDARGLANELVLLAGLDLEDLGDIDLGDDESKVPVAEDYWEDMVVAVSGQELGGQVAEMKGPRRRGRRR